MVELNARDDFDGDDGCRCDVDDKAKRRPPTGVGDVVSGCCQRSFAPCPSSPATSSQGEPVTAAAAKRPALDKRTIYQVAPEAFHRVHAVPPPCFAFHTPILAHKRREAGTACHLLSRRPTCGSSGGGQAAPLSDARRNATLLPRGASA